MRFTSSYRAYSTLPCWDVTLLSCPAQKAVPPPVRMTTRTSESCSAACAAARTSSYIWLVVAFRLSGRFNVIVARDPFLS